MYHKENPCNKISIKSEQELAYNVLDSLVALYEKRDKEYINLWGYDEWEKTFKFQNYDYDYFDRLDELYEEEMQNNIDNNTDDEIDFITDYDKFNNYWKH